MISTTDKRTLFMVMLSIMATSWVFFKEPVEMYAGYVVVLLLLPVYIFRYGVPPKFWYFVLFFLFTGLFNVMMGNDTMEQFLKIFIGLMISYLFYFFVLRRFDFDVKILFRWYMMGMTVACVIGMVQFVSYLVKFTPGYDFTWLPMFNKWGVPIGGNLGLRVNSIFSEPSTFAAVCAPAMFVALNNLLTNSTFFIKRWESILILGVYLLTFSSVGYIGIFVAILLMMVHYGFARFIFLFVPLLAFAFLYLYQNVDEFRYRLDSTIFLFQTGEVNIYEEHGSSIVFYNNFVVATENFGNNFLFGSGLGSHPVAFEKYSITRDLQTFGFSNNGADANSMLLRIISEIGLIGVVFAFIFIRRNFVRKGLGDSKSVYWLISSGCLCIIILYMLRQGHYFLNGFPFFAWMYFYSRQGRNEELERIANGIEDEDEDENDEE